MPGPTAEIWYSPAIWLLCSSCSEAITGLVSPTSMNTVVAVPTLPAASLKRLVGPPEPARNPTATASTTEPRNKRFIVDTSMGGLVGCVPFFSLKLLAYSRIVPPRHAEQIHAQEFSGIVHGLAADEGGPRGDARLPDIIGV